MRKTYLEWVEIVNNLAYDEVLVDMLSDWQADGLFRTDCINKLEARIAELSQALGLITTLKPTMVMDTDHPLDMAKEVAEYVTARIAELEAVVDKLIWSVEGRVEFMYSKHQREFEDIVAEYKEREE